MWRTNVPSSKYLPPMSALPFQCCMHISRSEFIDSSQETCMQMNKIISPRGLCCEKLKGMGCCSRIDRAGLGSSSQGKLH